MNHFKRHRLTYWTYELLQAFRMQWIHNYVYQGISYISQLHVETREVVNSDMPFSYIRLNISKNLSREIQLPRIFAGAIDQLFVSCDYFHCMLGIIYLNVLYALYILVYMMHIKEQCILYVSYTCNVTTKVYRDIYICACI